MALPWLSVVIPADNGQAFLDAALQSLLRQRAGDGIEIIAVDDGSCDETLAILTGYSRRLPIRSERLPHSGNWVIGTNVGLSLARGKYACFLHQDDRWCDNRLQTLRSLADQHPQIPLLIHPSWYVDASGARVGRLSCPVRANGGLVDAAELVHGLLIQCFLTTCAPVFRMDVVRETGDLDETLWYSADWEFWLRLAGVAGAVLHPERLCEFRLHRASQTSVRAIDPNDLQRQHDEVLSRHLPRAVEHGPDSMVARLANFSAKTNVGLSAWRNHDGRRIRSLVPDVLRLGPIGIWRYMNSSRITERAISRLRAGLRRTAEGYRDVKLEAPVSRDKARAGISGAVETGCLS